MIGLAGTRDSALPRTGRLVAGFAIVIATIGSGFAGGAGTVAAASGCPLGMTASSPISPPGGTPFVICSGRIPSFDGTPIDTDVSVPVGASSALPLMVMMNGWGGDKTNWESTTLQGNDGDQYHWNNAWFVSQGYAVLNYTARGFHRSCGKDPATSYSYASDPACTGRSSWTHLGDRRWETHDSQYLVGLLVDAGVANPTRVVATGGSYGGGQSWLLALSQDSVMAANGSTSPWTSPGGTPIHIAAAAPKYPWSDLLEALVDNGRASDGFHRGPKDGDHASPIGVEKQSYVEGLFALGGVYAQFAAAGVDPTADLLSWKAALSAGEPYESNPTVAAAITQIQNYRSPYYMAVPKGSAQVPVFDFQGLTDPLFPGIQALVLERRLAKAHYPVWTFMGDLGHSYANNPSAMWHAADDEANTWLQQVMSAQSPSAPKFTVDTVACEPGQTGTLYSAGGFPALANRRILFSDNSVKTTSSSTPPGQEAAGADPIANSGCRTITEQTDSGVAAWNIALPRPRVLIGSPVVSLTATLTGSNAELAARLWDVDSTAGTQTLVTRSVYRLLGGTSPTTQQLNFELWPTAWQVLQNHHLKLELTQVDSPTWRSDNIASTMQLSNLQVGLPAR